MLYLRKYIEENLIVLFRAANFYINFRDVPEYYVTYIGDALSWLLDELRDAISIAPGSTRTNRCLS